jgi:hypothetical protein
MTGYHRVTMYRQHSISTVPLNTEQARQITNITTIGQSFEMFIKIYFYPLDRKLQDGVVTKPCMKNFVDIQTPTHDHSQRITHYCRRLSVVSR